MTETCINDDCKSEWKNKLLWPCSFALVKHMKMKAKDLSKRWLVSVAAEGELAVQSVWCQYKDFVTLF